eukprot:m.485566 g.485566  ORF g.485566 m.485566 type:complete len:78 (-) comp21736_c0_seq1:1318-1551(-)
MSASKITLKCKSTVLAATMGPTVVVQGLLPRGGQLAAFGAGRSTSVFGFHVIHTHTPKKPSISADDMHSYAPTNVPS